MTFRLDISAGEFFEIIRPAMLFVAAFLSSFILFHARKRFGTVGSFAWAIATFVLTPVVFPLYFAVLIVRRRADGLASQRHVRFLIAIPLIYLLALTAFISVYLLHDAADADTHLARATQARLAGKQQSVIAEYRLALAQEDDAHTHKLLAEELAEAGYWTEALGEYRLAERGGEPDEFISFRIATLLDQMGNVHQATLEYEKFLDGKFCFSAPEEPTCVGARKRVEAFR